MINKHFAVFVSMLICLTGYLGCQLSTSEKDASTESSYLRDELSIQSGLELFNQYCTPCHNFEENGIGPNLSGITAEVDKKWLKGFIANAPEMIESGDERASQLLEKYKQPMPAFTMLDDEQIEFILSFMNRFTEGEKKNRNNRPGGLLNPIKAQIPISNLTLVLEKWLTVPASAKNRPLARINKFLSITSNKSERMFIHDLRGKLYEIRNDTTSVYLDVVDWLPNFTDNPGWGTGLGSFAFHPLFEKNGLLYTTHTESKNAAIADFALEDSINVTLQWVLTEWKIDHPDATSFSGSHRELLRADMNRGSHGFQELTFNPLSKPGEADFANLYLCIGDGGMALRGYPFHCNNPGKIWGTIIRIDPTGTNAANGNYGIPEDNPFVSDPDALGEVWAYGFRNPHRISWDMTGSGKMFISNIGQHSIEEVNLGIAGGNYGWPDREGTFLFDVFANPELVYPLPDIDSGYVYPVAQYDHDEGNAISGGFAYAGTEVPVLKGKYIFGDIPRGKIYYSNVREMEIGKLAPIYELRIAVNGQTTDLKTETNDIRVNLRFGTDHTGELFIFTKSDGNLYKVVDCRKDIAELIIDN